MSETSPVARRLTHRLLACASLALALAGCDAATSDDGALPGEDPTAAARAAEPAPIPEVLSATDLGIVRQHPAVNARDGNYSALIDGRSVWAFNDTPMNVPGVDGDSWVDNSLAWTTGLDASDGITLDGNHLDQTGAPAEFMPYLPWERRYNEIHDDDDCQEEPCGAEFALWPAHIVPDPARDRVLVFYNEIWRSPTVQGWRYLGGGIAVADLSGNVPKVTRPIQNPGSRTPTLMWTQKDGEQALDSGYVVEGDHLYSYGCTVDFLVLNCQVGRVPLADALDKRAWRYYAGNGAWSADQGDAETVFQGGTAGQGVAYVPAFDGYLVVYSGLFSDDVFYRVSQTPWGPWSEQRLLFHGRPGWDGNANYAAHLHPEFAEDGGRVQYVTYVHNTGFLRQELPLVRVEFAEPAN